MMDATIIIPTYNRLWALPEAIASCPRREDIEIIVVDDGSTDGTWEWLKDQPNIRAIRQPNWGKPAAVNAGIAMAKGAFVRFLDSDDLLIGQAVLDQLALAKAHQTDICVAGYLARYEASSAEIAHDWVDCGDFLAQQLGECDSSHYSAFFFKRSFITHIPHRPEFAFRDDRMFILECALAMPKVAAFSQPTLIHRHHGRSRIQFQPGSVAVVTNWQELQMFRKIAAMLETRDQLTERRRAAIANNIWPLAQRIAGYNRSEARSVLRWLKELHPQFSIPRLGINRLYAGLGFSTAQSIVNTVRPIRNWLRTMGLRRRK
jgi:glycosyltransferase involved in cell wall biosynthesis